MVEAPSGLNVVTSSDDIHCECGQLRGKHWVGKGQKKWTFASHYHVTGAFLLGVGKDKGLLICAACRKPALMWGEGG